MCCEGFPWRNALCYHSHDDVPQTAVEYAMQDYKKAFRRAKVKLGASLKAKDPRNAVFEDAELDKLHRESVSVAFATFAAEAVRVRGCRRLHLAPPLECDAFASGPIAARAAPCRDSM